jgi:hypothetical protein
MAGVKDSSLTNKATTPSKVIQNAVNTSWGAQNKDGNGGIDPKTNLNNKYNEHPVSPESMK